MADIAFIIGCYIVMPVVLIVFAGCWVDHLSARRWVRATEQAYGRVHGSHSTPSEGDLSPERSGPKR